MSIRSRGVRRATSCKAWVAGYVTVPGIDRKKSQSRYLRANCQSPEKQWMIPPARRERKAERRLYTSAWASWSWMTTGLPAAAAISNIAAIYVTVVFEQNQGLLNVAWSRPAVRNAVNIFTIRKRYAMKQTKRTERIYRKTKTVDIDLTPDSKLRVTVSHDDPRHDMSLKVVFTMPALVIETIECNMVRFPRGECPLAEPSLKEMVGMQMVPGIVKLAREKGPSRGCTHLNNLFHEACYAVIQGQGIYRRGQLEKLLPGLDSEQILKIMLMLRPQLLDSCVAFNAHSNLMHAVKKAQLPLEGDDLEDLLGKL